MTSKKEEVETANLKNNAVENETIKIENGITKIKMSEFHSLKYLDKLKETTYKGKEVVFILPNGKEYK